MILRARLVLPISGPPLHDGAIAVTGRRIRAIGRWHELASHQGSKLDLGEVILMPGLINSHCHLDYTDMAGHFHAPKLFTDWLKLITSTKAGWDLADFKRSWQRGADMLVRTGTTSVVDIEAVPQLLPDMWSATPLRVFSLLEMIGITARRPPQVVLQEALAKAASLKHSRCRVGFSPHAPYSTVPELLRIAGVTARRQRRLTCTHVAESSLEFEMFKTGGGVMFEWLKLSGRDMADCGSVSPVQHLERCGLLRNGLMAAHANYLGRSDARLLGRRGVTVIHCPRSHAYFKHDRLPWQPLLRAGVNICLGTDSLASVSKDRRHQKLELNLFEEMQTLANREPWLPPQKIIRMVTLNGARAVAMETQLGHFKAGALADLIALPFAGKTSAVYEQVLAHKGDVAASLIDGRWAMAPAHLKTRTSTRAVLA